MSEDVQKKLNDLLKVAADYSAEGVRSSKKRDIEGVSLEGELLKSHHGNRLIIRVNPDASNSKDIEFNQSDIVEIEELKRTETKLFVRLWVKYEAPYKIIVVGRVKSKKDIEEKPMIRKVFQGRPPEADLNMRGCSCPSCSCSCPGCSCNCTCDNSIIKAIVMSPVFDGMFDANIKATIGAGNFAGNISAYQWW